MKERPILFSGAMVRAILAGEKTQTRRVVKGIPDKFCCGDVAAVTNGESWAISKLPDCVAYPPDDEPGILCPYGKPGDRLWVRETALPDFPKEFSYYEWTWAEVPDEYRKPEFCIYKASWTGAELVWKPPIFMPRWASRITLEVTGVRVERLQDITERDARAEGAKSMDIVTGRQTLDPNSRQGSCIAHYRHIWDSINAKTAPWASNPWVWVVEFKREGL